ncbi:MAG TPA: Gfo/Idh/MocA family oxidoreductase [Pseudolabrys sp.]|nr:Gfo/Idh/MocA family oxidoreductase [Pseudolabrys sp.]
MSYSVLLVGLGQIAMGYDLGSTSDNVILTHARAFTTHPAFALAGGVDPSLERRDLFFRSYGLAAQADLASALSRGQPDVVVITAPTPHHGEILRDVLARTPPRAVLCEKPLSYSRQEAREMVRLCEEKGCALYVNYPRRAAPGSREVKRRLSNREIAGPLKGVSWYSKGLLHNGSHFVNLVEYWLGPITGFAIIATGRRWDDSDPEPDVRIDFAGGSVSFFAARDEDYSLHEIDLVASNGRLRYSRGGERILWQPAVADAHFEGYKVLSDAGEDIRSDAQMTQWHVADQLAKSLQGEDADICSGTDALKTIEWLMKIRDAL